MNSLGNPNPNPGELLILCIFKVVDYVSCIRSLYIYIYMHIFENLTYMSDVGRFNILYKVCCG